MAPNRDPEYIPEPPETYPGALPSVPGRGSAHNPANRFVPISVEPDDEVADPDDHPLPRTRIFRDTSHSIITTNDSPDVGFEASINPYRGCEHGCAYCVDGDTRILMGNGDLRALRDIRVGDIIYGTMRAGFYRRYVKTRVLAHWSTRKPAFRTRLEDGTTLITSGDHRFLTERGWKFVQTHSAGGTRRPHLTPRNKLMGIGSGAAAAAAIPGAEYRRGYLCGMIRGDGHLGHYFYSRTGRTHDAQHRFRLALADTEALERSERFLRDFGISTRSFVFAPQEGYRREIRAIRVQSYGSVERIQSLIGWPPSPDFEWNRGFLSGLFDAEGSYSQGILRITNTDRVIVEVASAGLRDLGFDIVVESRTRTTGKPIHAIRIRGGLGEHLRFIRVLDPAISRKREISGSALKSSARLRILTIEPLPGMRPLFDITTGTGDFIANGVVSHNCYARPTHEYFGLSAGLDFETQLFAKQDAPDLLRRELVSRKWKPKVLAMSGVTDPYQPVERRLGITRGCLEVLARFRNPVVIITKNHLVTRDIDLLAELAHHHAAAVYLSVTTLDEDLRRTLEPRTSPAARRLDAIRILAEAGVPTGVLMAPIIPGLTEPEIPAVLAGAREAGAVRAGYIVLRLPYQVGPLFEAWLERHRPLARERILGRIRALRGGRLNDPRFGSRMRGEGFHAGEIQALFRLAARRTGLATGPIPLSPAAFRPPPGRQGELFPE